MGQDLIPHRQSPERVRGRNFTFHLAQDPFRCVGAPVASHPHVEHGRLGLRGGGGETQAGSKED